MSIRLQAVDLSLEGWTPTTKEAADLENGENASQAKILATPLESLTQIALDGSGAFDCLMRATKLHLQEEYNASRITGQEYATVYLGALTAVLQTSIQFLLNEQQVHRINAEIGLIRQQTVTELTKTDDSIPEGLGFNFRPAVPVAIPPIS